jgi:hypothetical protein
VFLVDTSTYHYKSRRAGQAGLEQRIKEIFSPALEPRAFPSAVRM